MKKFITLLVLVLAFTANAMSQITTAGKPETIASFRMGTCKLVKTGDQYKISGQTKDNRFLRMNVELGDKEKAAALLRSMVDYEASRNEQVALNNSTENFAIWVGTALSMTMTTSANAPCMAIRYWADLRKSIRSLRCP